MNKQDAKRIAKVHIYSLLYLGDSFYAENLSFEDNKKITEEIKSICQKELEKINVGSHTTSDNCVEAILNKKR